MLLVILKSRIADNSIMVDGIPLPGDEDAAFQDYLFAMPSLRFLSKKNKDVRQLLRLNLPQCRKQCARRNIRMQVQTRLHAAEHRLRRPDLAPESRKGLGWRRPLITLFSKRKIPLTTLTHQRNGIEVSTEFQHDSTMGAV